MNTHVYLHNTHCVCVIPIVYLYFWKCGNELVDQLEQVATLPLLQLEMNTRLMLIEVCFFDFLLSVFVYNPGHHLTLIFSLVCFNSKHNLTWSLQFFDNRTHNLTFISPFNDQHIISQERRCYQIGARPHCKARPERHKVIHQKLFKNLVLVLLQLCHCCYILLLFCNFDIVIFSTKHCQQEVVTICSLMPVANIFL